MKLGRLAKREDPRTFRLATYLRDMVVPPESCVWSGKVKDWGMMLNDQIGCCTMSASGHAIQLWTSNIYRDPLTVHDAAILEAYQGLTGYDPANPDTDTGASMLDALRYWHRTGIRWPKGALDNCGAYAEVNHNSTIQVRHTIYLFGCAYAGVSLPISAQSQDVWDATGLSGDGAPNSWGGHCILLVGYDPDGVTCVTWGGLQKMTWNFLRAYVDEIYAVFDHDWINDADKAPNGLDVARLRADLAAL